MSLSESFAFGFGFDTVVVNANAYNYESVKQLLAFFPKYSFNNFIFLFDYDFKLHSLPFQKEKIKSFISNIKPVLPRGVHITAYFNLLLDHSSTLNKNILKLRANKSSGTLFVTLPPLHPDNYDIYAKDINKLLYDNKICPVFVGFDKLLSISDRNIWNKLFGNKNAIFTFDILNPNNESIIDEIIQNDISIIPTLSSHCSEYAGITENIKFYIERYGKQKYNKLSFKVEKTLNKIF